MIEVWVERNEEGLCRGLRVQGHAEFADPGEDIVCAAVSSITGVLGIATEQAESNAVVVDVGEGLFFWQVVQDAMLEEGLQACAQAVARALEEVAEHYQGFIVIKAN